MDNSEKEIPNNNIEIKPLTNKRTWTDFIQNDAYMEFPQKQDWRQRFICTLLEWASLETSVEITDFALEMKMRRQTVKDWAAKYPDIKDAYDQAKLMIGSRKRKGALTRKFDKDVVFKDLHRYDPEWLEINKYHSDMKKEEEKMAHTFIINGEKPRIVSKAEMKGNPEETVENEPTYD
jgi:hypothetical protein